MKLSLCLHDHQPVGNFPEVFQSAFSCCYLPMLEELERHPLIRTGLHVSGPLLEWLQRNEPGYVHRVSALAREGRLELLTSGRYEPILTVFPRSDIISQINDYSGLIEELTGRRPDGLWLTERVWEPGLASLLAEAGVRYAVVDDVHLLRAGVPPERLDRPWVTEDGGRQVTLLAGSRRMRYLVPFRPVEEVTAWLREMEKAGTGLVFYGDDGEKFGVWPGTADLCYRDGWLDRFFTSVESADWLETLLPSEAAGLPADGPVYVPAASYAEMSEWTLDADAAADYRVAVESVSAALSPEAAEVLVAGGFWRNFLSLYPESGELHGRVISAAEPVSLSGDVDALGHLWRSQCNCAYWHGVFGGIYLPHLREALWKELHVAENRALDVLDGFPRIISGDLDSDGRQELLVVTRRMSVTVRPELGAAVSELALIRPDGEPVPFGHVLTRQRESYHLSIPGTAGETEGTKSIHDAPVAREEGLADRLVVDLWRRMSFTDLLIPADSSVDDYACASPAIKSFQSAVVTAPETIMDDTGISVSCELHSDGTSVSKSLRVSTAIPFLEAHSVYTARSGDRIGMEVCLNLMTGSSPDRFVRVDGGEEVMLGVTGVAVASRVEVVDRWRKAMVVILPDSPVDFWHTPIESVNMSESGFERVHQGLAMFFSGLADGDGRFSLTLRLELREL